MGIYIPDMEMPKSCEECLCRTKDASGGLGCQATGYIPLRKANQDRPDWCPIIPIPKHGRLIDADKYLSRIRPLTPEDSLAGCTFETVKLLMVNSINDAPTIIPASGGAEDE